MSEPKVDLKTGVRGTTDPVITRLLETGQSVRIGSMPTSRRAAFLGALACSAMSALVIPLPATGAPVSGLGAVPTAACSQMIYSGSTPKAVVRTRYDVVVGPVRFGELKPSLVQKTGGVHLLGIKSPLTVGPTQFPELLVSAKGAKGHVSVVYGQVPSTTNTALGDLQTDPNRVVVQAPASCGLPVTGFVQYAGGFSIARKQCVTLTVSVPGGRVLARRTVPFGSSVSCAQT